MNRSETKYVSFAKDELSLAIDRVIQQGDHVTALDLIADYRDRIKLNPSHRVRISLWLMRIGQSAEALRILGRELSLAELKCASVEEIVAQVRLAAMLDMQGATVSALRLLRNCEAVAREYEIRWSEVYPDINRWKADIYLGQYNYEAALTEYRIYSDNCEKNSHSYFMAQLGVSDCLEGMGDSAGALTIADELLAHPGVTGVVRGICHQARGEYLLRSEAPVSLDLALSEFDAAETFFPPSVQSRDRAYLAKWRAAGHLLRGDLPKARAAIEIGFSILNQPKMRPAALLEVLYWREKVEIHGKLGEQIALRCHPANSPYAYLSGKQKSSTEVNLHPWIARRADQLHHDAWLITPSAIQPVLYQSTIRLGESHRPMSFVIDLVSGLIHRAGLTEVLTSAQSRLYLALAGSGALGLTQWSLIDFVYGDDFFEPHNAEEKLKKLLSYKNAGLKCLNLDGKIFLDVPTGATLILPMSGSVSGPLAFLSAKSDTFTRKSIEDSLKMSKSTAAAWLKQWHDENLITIQQIGKQRFYRKL